MFETSCRKFRYKFFASPRDREGENKEKTGGGTKRLYTYYDGRG
jgi:hypothetical protein